MVIGVATGDNCNGPGESGESRHKANETLLFTAGWLLCSLQLRQMSSDRLVILLKWPNLETCILQIMLHEAS